MNTDLTTVIDEIEAIDWDAQAQLPGQTTMSPEDRDPALYEFISRMAELIPNDKDWNEFTIAFQKLETARGRR